MHSTVVFGLIGLLLLLGCAALLNAAEAAYFSLGRLRLHLHAAEREPADSLRLLLKRPHELLVTLLVGITLTDIGASALALVVAHQLFGRWGLAVATGAMILLVTVLTEILPMTLAVDYAPAAVPESGTPVLLGAGLAGVASVAGSGQRRT